MDVELFRQTYSYDKECCVANGFWAFYFENQEVLQSNLFSTERRLLLAFKAGFEFAKNGWIRQHEREILGVKKDG